ncbi:PREDICTED: transmembrane protein 243 isoform X2 [Gekko japonicus]|uniref:Transmembrane protein 243 isoform X2 n=1 Tax=Gekko japonicus TaxID=146911 RepID=A0ABM1LCA5_GEKJA|nr:PREDICTED: transmembrane protein 243 isoform X2 [Gekko japonicus]
MEDFTTRTYGTRGVDNRPLFGETSPRDRIINLAVGSITSLLLIVTLISAFVFPQLPPKPLNIFFAFCISLCSISAGILWVNDCYRAQHGLRQDCLDGSALEVDD